ncbi:hypothetical protein EIP91_001666 [Steccherinum ochraceum]|uniref:Uncharacterized protein n=1 Tax=Steccherinum ochraceum TaxID=92696 RepID=A0A4R0RHA3_9APHY|nr:hypothetical protein EIP91_001666 [Steccherinum ochraceum]
MDMNVWANDAVSSNSTFTFGTNPSNSIQDPFASIDMSTATANPFNNSSAPSFAFTFSSKTMSDTNVFPFAGLDDSTAAWGPRGSESLRSIQSGQSVEMACFGNGGDSGSSTLLGSVPGLTGLREAGGERSDTTENVIGLSDEAGSGDASGHHRTGDAYNAADGGYISSRETSPANDSDYVPSDRTSTPCTPSNSPEPKKRVVGRPRGKNTGAKAKPGDRWGSGYLPLEDRRKTEKFRLQWHAYTVEAADARQSIERTIKSVVQTVLLEQTEVELLRQQVFAAYMKNQTLYMGLEAQGTVPFKLFTPPAIHEECVRLPSGASEDEHDMVASIEQLLGLPAEWVDSLSDEPYRFHYLRIAADSLGEETFAVRSPGPFPRSTANDGGLPPTLCEIEELRLERAHLIHHDRMTQWRSSLADLAGRSVTRLARFRMLLRQQETWNVHVTASIELGELRKQASKMPGAAAKAADGGPLAWMHGNAPTIVQTIMHPMGMPQPPHFSFTPHLLDVLDPMGAKPVPTVGSYDPRLGENDDDYANDSWLSAAVPTLDGEP